MKALFVMLKSRYVGHMVIWISEAIDVWSMSGEHKLAIRDGRDQSKHLGCSDELDMSNIPKAARLYKECPKSGHVIKDEKHSERLQSRKEFLDEKGKVRSIESLKEEGFEFDVFGSVSKRPAKKVEAEQVQS